MCFFCRDCAYVTSDLNLHFQSSRPHESRLNQRSFKINRMFSIKHLLRLIEAKLRAAAKARIIRWIKPHKKRQALNAPEWLQKEWGSGDKNVIADLLSHVNFDKDRSPIQILKAIGGIFHVTFCSFCLAGDFSQQAHHLHSQEADGRIDQGARLVFRVRAHWTWLEPVSPLFVFSFERKHLSFTKPLEFVSSWGPRSTEPNQSAKPWVQHITGHFQRKFQFSKIDKNSRESFDKVGKNLLEGWTSTMAWKNFGWPWKRPAPRRKAWPTKSCTKRSHRL